MKIGLLSDIHEDYGNLKKALQLLEKKGADMLVCLGDIVGFNINSSGLVQQRDANKCIEAVRESCDLVIAGNHDLNAAKRITKYTAGYDIPSNWFEMSIEQRTKDFLGELWIYNDDLPAEITKKNIDFLASLPELSVKPLDNFSLLFSHYMYPDISGSTTQWITDYTSGIPHLDFINRKNADMAFSGHAHANGIFHLFPENFKKLPFPVKMPLDRFPTCIFLPAVTTESIKRQGVLIFNTENSMLTGYTLEKNQNSDNFLLA